MQIHNPETIIVGLFVFVQGCLVLLSGQKAAHAQKLKEDAATHQAAHDADRNELQEDFNRCKAERDELRAKLEARDKKLSKHRVTAEMMLERMDVPGAMKVMLDYCEKYWETHPRPDDELVKKDAP